MTTLQKFAKDNGLKIHQARELVRNALNVVDMPDTLTPHDLAEIEVYKLSGNQKQLASKEHAQLPASKEDAIAATSANEPTSNEPLSTNTSLTTTDTNSIEQTEQPTGSHLSIFEQLEQVSSELELIRVKQNLDDEYTLLTNAYKVFDEKKEQFLLKRLQNTYNVVKAHKPVEEYRPNTSNIDDMMTKLKGLGIDIKS